MDEQSPNSGPVFPFKKLLFFLVPALAAALYFIVIQRGAAVKNPQISNRLTAPESEENVVSLQATNQSGAVVTASAQNLHFNQGEEINFSVNLSDIERKGDAAAEIWQLFVSENGQPPVPINPTDPLQWTYVANSDVRETKICVLHLLADDSDAVLRAMENFAMIKGKNCINAIVDASLDLNLQNATPADGAASGEPEAKP